MVVPGCHAGGGCTAICPCSGGLGKKRLVPDIVGGTSAFFVFLFIFAWERYSCRAPKLEGGDGHC